MAIQAANGGVNCSGLSNITEDCNIQKCPGSKIPQGLGSKQLILMLYLSFRNKRTDKNVISVNCEWGEWEIGSCSVECGGGKQTNSRSIKINAEHGGTNCSGLSMVTEICNIQECPGIIIIRKNNNISQSKKYEKYETLFKLKIDYFS